MATLVLRQIKGSPITDTEMDSNFSNLNRDSYLSTRNSTPWVASTPVSKGEIINVVDRFYTVTVAGTTGSSAPTHTTGTATNGTATLQYTIPAYYSAKDVLDKIKTLHGINSGLDSDLLRGQVPSSVLPTTTDKSSVVSRDAAGDSTFNNISATKLNVSQISVSNGVGANGQFLTSTGTGTSWTTVDVTPVITEDSSSSSVKYITFVDGTGTQPLKVDTTGLAYNPLSNILFSNFAGNFTGNLTGTASNNATFGANTFTGQQTVPTEAYGVSWNNNYTVPTKHSVRGAIENISSKFTGVTFWWIGNVPPAGAMVVPLVPTNLSRTTYANLHAVVASLGYPWGVGDGVNTFGSPYCRSDYSIINANGNTGTESAGQVMSHNHQQTNSARDQDAGGAGTGSMTVGGGSFGGLVSSANYTNSSGGSANYPAGVRFTLCIWI